MGVNCASCIVVCSNVNFEETRKRFRSVATVNQLQSVYPDICNQSYDAGNKYSMSSTLFSASLHGKCLFMRAKRL